MTYPWVDIDIWTTAVRELHRLANGVRSQAWVKVLTKVLVELKAEQDALRAELLLQTSYSGQTASTEKCLNDAYDPTSRRITIINHPTYLSLLYLREDSEGLPLVYMRELPEGRQMIYMREDNEQPLGTTGDFTVYCPLDVSPLPTPQQLAKLVNVYRPAGMRWNMVYTDAATGLPTQDFNMTPDPTTI